MYSQEKSRMALKNIRIEETKGEDIKRIYALQEQAFGYEKEAVLTSELLGDKTAMPCISLLAYHEDEPVGHILFTRVYIEDRNNTPLAHILAPLAVKPAFQKQGVGGMLISAGIEKLKQMGSELVFVLGHMDYYPRYGFIPDAENLGFSAPYPIPPEFANAWMVQALGPQGLSKAKGTVICADALNKPEHWRE